MVRGTWYGSKIYRVHVDPESCAAVAPFSGERPEFLTCFAEVAALQEPTPAAFDGRGSEHRDVRKSPSQRLIGFIRTSPAFENN